MKIKEVNTNPQQDCSKGNQSTSEKYEEGLMKDTTEMWERNNKLKNLY